MIPMRALIAYLLKYSLVGAILVFLPTSAHAQYLVSNANGGAPVKMFVKTDNAKLSEARRRIERSGLPKPTETELRRAFNFSGTDKRVSFEKLENAQGQTLIEPIYAQIFPISTIAALVQRDDRSYGIVDISSKTFRALPKGQIWAYRPFDGKAPVTFLLGEEAADGTYRYCFTLPDVSCGKWVNNVIGPITSDFEKTSAFTFANKIVINRLDTKGAKISTSYSWNGDVVLDNAPPVKAIHTRDPKNLKKRELQSIVYDLGRFDHDLGDYNTNLYWPMDGNGTPATGPSNFIGMFPLHFYFDKDSDFVSDLSGYAIVMDINDTRMFRIAPDIKDALAALATNRHTYLWHDLYFQNAGYSNSDSFSLAAKRISDDQSDMWLSLHEAVTKNSRLNERVDEAWGAGNGFPDPTIAINTRGAKESAAQKAELQARLDGFEQRARTLAALKSRGRTINVNDELCYEAQQFSAKSTDDASRQFIAAFGPGSREACRYMPVSIYNAMVNSGMISEQQGPPPAQTGGFAAAVADWNKNLDRQRDFNRGKSLRCYVNEGQRICYYN